ncbi:MAG: hypothetical protein JJE47_03600 [Acidimicrobiia bacterium]|nr:hypothetical protein [Acidimicrobiia bacterium]
MPDDEVSTAATPLEALRAQRVEEIGYADDFRVQFLPHDVPLHASLLSGSV